MQLRFLRSALIPSTLVLAAAPLLAGGGETALSAAETAEVEALFEELLTFESKCTDACAEAAYAAKKAAKKEGAAKKVAKKGGYGYGSEAKGCGGCGEVNPTSAMLVRLSKNPETWSVVTPLIEKRFAASDATEDLRGRILDMLAWEPSDVSAEVAGNLWKATPAAFTEGNLVTFAQRGSEACIGGVEKLAKKGAVVPAAYLAFRGDETGRKALAKAAKLREITPETVSNALLAGAALHKLGDEKTLKKLQKRIHADVLKRLDAGDVETAAKIAVCAQLGAKVREAGKTAALGEYEKMVGKFCEERLAELAHNCANTECCETTSSHADRVFQLIEKVTPM